MSVFSRKWRRPFNLCTLAAALLVVSATVAAGPRGSLTSIDRSHQRFDRGNAYGVFSLKPYLQLDPVTALELTGGGSNLAFSTGERGFGRGAFQMPNLRNVVTRSIPELWRLRMPLKAKIFALDVSYELVGANGRSSCLCSLEKTDSEITVAIDEILPRIIGRDPHSMVIGGGMVMHLNLEAVRSAGTHSGTLTVVINHF